MGEHGIFPPASLQSNDPPKVFSLTLTTAYKRDQFLPAGQCEETESFNGEWRWGQKARRKIAGETLSSAVHNEAPRRYKMLDTSVKLQLSCPVAGVQNTVCFIWTTEHGSLFRLSQHKKKKIKHRAFDPLFCRYVLPIHKPQFPSLISETNCTFAPKHVWSSFIQIQERFAGFIWPEHLWCWFLEVKMYPCQLQDTSQKSKVCMVHNSRRPSKTKSQYFFTCSSVLWTAQKANNESTTLG